MTIPVDHAKVPVRLERGPGAEGRPAWRVSADTVDAIPRLWDRYGVGWVGEVLPPVFFRVRFLEVDAWQWLGLGLSLLAAFVVALLLGAAFRFVGLRLARRTKVSWDDALIRAASGPVKALLGLGTFAAGAGLLHLAVPAQSAVDHVTKSGLVLVLTWAGLRGVGLIADLLEARLADHGGDVQHTRGAKTQIVVLRRVADVILVVLGGALLLLQFQGLRNLGTSLLASAGVAGIVIGLAAQKSISMLLAGIQLSITQPVRLGDVVIVEGEWGTIEELTLTYAVLKVWDLRRLVIPIDRFLSSPFQNWTKKDPDLLGTVFLYADYTVPVEKLRDEVTRFVKTRAEWDGKTSGLVVTNVSEHTVELRALVSAADSSKAWDLRCALREHLVSYLQQLDGGRYLPRARVAASDDIARLEPAAES